MVFVLGAILASWFLGAEWEWSALTAFSLRRYGSAVAYLALADTDIDFTFLVVPMNSLRAPDTDAPNVLESRTC